MTGAESGQGDGRGRGGIALEVPGRFAWRVLELIAIAATCYMVARAYEVAALEVLLHRVPFSWYGSREALELAMVLHVAACGVLPVSLLFVLSVYLARLRYRVGLRELGWHVGSARGAAVRAAGLGILGGLLWYAAMWWVDELPTGLRYTGYIGPRLPYVWQTYATRTVSL